MAGLKYSNFKSNGKQIVANLDMDDLHCWNVPRHHPFQEIIPRVAHVVPHSTEELIDLSCDLKPFSHIFKSNPINLTA